MPRRALRVSTIVVGLLMLLGGASALSASSDNDSPPSKRFDVVAPEVDRVFLDLGESGLSRWDQIIIDKHLFLKDDPETRVGDDVVHCVVTVIEGDQKVATLCDVVYTFDGVGQIMAQGRSHLDLTSTNEFDIAITGGTGDFKGEGGFVHVIQRPAGGDHDLTFHLEDVVPKALR
jgi:hypothetical protein